MDGHQRSLLDETRLGPARHSDFQHS
jgi:hypothetical protein